MTKEEAIEVEGLVTEILGGGKYKVQIVDMDMAVEAYAAGKMKKFRIKIIPGDLVTVELNPYEPTKGRIVYRTINNGKGKKRESRGAPVDKKAKKPKEGTSETPKETKASPKK